MKNTNAPIMVSYHTSEEGDAVMLVCKPRMSTESAEMDILNLYQGEEAAELWAKLTISQDAPVDVVDEQSTVV